MEKQSEIIMLLDRSGSMKSIRQETIKGFNDFIDKQKELSVKSKISLSQFSHEYQVDFERIPVIETPILNRENYMPDGLTALLDAIGNTIKSHRKYQKAEQNGSETQTTFVIITDGYENASTNYSLEKIFKLIKKMETKYNWQFVYLGANQDAIKVASTLGIIEKRAIRFASDSLGTQEIFNTVSERVSERVMCCRDVSFLQEDRDKQER